MLLSLKKLCLHLFLNKVFINVFLYFLYDNDQLFQTLSFKCTIINFLENGKSGIGESVLKKEVPLIAVKNRIVWLLNRCLTAKWKGHRLKKRVWYMTLVQYCGRHYY